MITLTAPTLLLKRGDKIYVTGSGGRRVTMRVVRVVAGGQLEVRRTFGQWVRDLFSRWFA